MSSGRYAERCGGSRTLGRGGGEDRIDLVADLVLAHALGDGELLGQKTTGGVEHLALTKRKLFRETQDAQVAEHLGDLEHAAGLDLLHVLAVATVPGLGVARDISRLQDR